MSLYDDIIDHEHYQSKKRPHMSMLNRAAQFSPFAALTGYEESIAETARLTESKIELSEDALEILNRKLNMIEEKIAEKPFVTITYFVEDSLKDGGAYVDVSGNVTKLDTFNRLLYIYPDITISLASIVNIDTEL